MASYATVVTISYCAIRELNADALVCLAVKWVGWVGLVWVKKN